MSGLTCPACNYSDRPPTLIGQLGSLIYVRCVGCHWAWHPEETEVEQSTKENEEES